MFTWTNQSIKWMDEAVAFTSYFYKLKETLSVYLKPDDKILEIACGTGHLAMALSPICKEVTAIDISDLTTKFFENEITKANIYNVTPLLGDWKSLCGCGKTFDAVIFSYFGAIIDDFSLLKEFSPRTIIAILPYSTHDGRYSQNNKPAHRKETVENVKDFLKNAKIAFQLIEKELEFGQPFETYSEAMAYMTYYYPSYSDDENKSFLDLNLVKKMGSPNSVNAYSQFKNETLYLTKKKKLGIFVISPF